jgi:ferredoxin-fold anticodon binding domain-containing protein
MQLINDLVGKKITVHSIQGETERQDVGTLEATDGTWMRLRKSETEVLIFTIYHIRLVKPFDAY